MDAFLAGEWNVMKVHHYIITGDKSGAEAPGPSGFPISFNEFTNVSFQNLSSDLEYFYLEAAGLQKDRRGL